MDTFGDLTSVLAGFYDKHLAGLTLQDGAGLAGAGATVAEARLSGLQKALLEYQKALLELRKLKGIGHATNVERATRILAVRMKFKVLQMRYRAEMNNLVNHADIGKNRGGPLTSAERGVTLATRGRKHRRLYVANTTQATKLAQLATATRYTGSGLIYLDAGLRVQKVHGVYKSGGDWQRQAVLETTGFGTGGFAGLVAGKAVISGMTVLGLAATPVGWVVMIGVAAAAGFGAGYIGDRLGKSGADFIYDRGWQ